MYSTGEKPITVIRNKPFNKPSHAPSISATSTCVCSTMTDWNSLLTASLNECAYTPQLRQCTTLLNCGGYWDQPPLRWILLTLQFRMTGCLERQRSAKPSIPKPEPTVDQVLVMVALFSWWACGASCGEHRSQTQVWIWLCLVISVVRLWWGAGRARGGRFLRVFCSQSTVNLSNWPGWARNIRFGALMTPQRTMPGHMTHFCCWDTHAR